MAKVSGKNVAEAILKMLQTGIEEKKLQPKLAIILAGNDPSSRIYVNNKLKVAQRIGIQADLFEFSKNEREKCLKTIKELDADVKTDGIIVQHPVFENWNYDDFISLISPQKDVDGFREDSKFWGATALAVWEMLTAFALKMNFKSTENFLKNKKIVLLGKGKAAGGPILKLLKEKGFEVGVIDKETENPNLIIKKGDVVISATGVKNIINKSNLKKGSFVVAVGVGKENVDGKMKIYGDINESDVSKIAKLYCPTIGGIGPLTIVSLLKNVVESAKRSKEYGFHG